MQADDHDDPGPNERRLASRRHITAIADEHAAASRGGHNRAEAAVRGFFFADDGSGGAAVVPPTSRCRGLSVAFFSPTGSIDAGHLQRSPRRT